MQEQFRNLDFYFSEISIFTSGYHVEGYMADEHLYVTSCLT